MIDLAAFVESPAPIQRSRFSAFYRWKGLDDAAIEMLWRAGWRTNGPRSTRSVEYADLILTASKP